MKKERPSWTSPGTTGVDGGSESGLDTGGNGRVPTPSYSIVYPWVPNNLGYVLDSLSS